MTWADPALTGPWCGATGGEQRSPVRQRRIGVTEVEARRRAPQPGDHRGDRMALRRILDRRRHHLIQWQASEPFVEGPPTIRGTGHGDPWPAERGKAAVGIGP